MKTIVTVKTGKGVMSTMDDVSRATAEVRQIAEFVGGNVVMEKNLCDGVSLIIER